MPATLRAIEEATTLWDAPTIRNDPLQPETAAAPTTNTTAGNLNEKQMSR